jgi:type I restriction enzyme S subunit
MSDNATGEYSIREPYKLPQGWRWEQWGDLMVDFQQGLIRSNSQLGAGNVDYLKMGDLDSSGGYSTSNLAQTEATNEEITSYALSNGDFLLNVRNSMELVGKTCVVGEIGKRPLLFNHMLVRVKHRHDIPNSFINAFFSTEVGRKFIARCKQGTTTVIALYKRDLVQIPIPIPNDKTVKFISDFWVAIQRKIELNQRMNEELEGMAKLLYDYWFVQYDFPMSAAQAKALGKPHLTGHPYRASGGPMTYHETLKREIPKGWEVRKLSTFCDHIRDTVDPSDVAPCTPYVGLEHVPRRQFTLDAWGTASSVTSLKSQFKSGDVLFGKLRPYFHKVVRAGMDGICTSELLVLRSIAPKFEGFLGSVLFSDVFVEATSNQWGGSKMPRAEWSRMKEYLVPCPPDDLLTHFNDRVLPMWELGATNQRQTQELTTLRDWLLPMLMNGQVTVGGGRDLMRF